MVSYAETISSSGSGPLVSSTGRGQSGVAGVAKFVTVVVAVAIIAAGIFAATYYGTDDTDMAPRDGTVPAGASFDGFDPNAPAATAANPVPPKPPKDPLSEDPEIVIAADPTVTGSAEPTTSPTNTPPGSAGSGAAATDATAPAATPQVLPASRLLPAFTKHSLSHEIDQQVMDYRFGDMLGDTFLFLEAQHSGNITSISGGSRIGWRDVQLLDDGEDIGVSLAGGMYEAGNRLKITLATSYLVSHLSWVCTFYEDTLAALQHDGESLLHWCKREVRWAVDLLLRTHRFPGSERPSDWNDATDSLILMVGGIPDDWDCYDRAEVIPSKKAGSCRSGAMRRTLVADADFPAAEVAGYAASAFAASAALLQKDDPDYAVEAMKSAYAVWKFGLKHNATAASWSVEVARTYGVDSPMQHLLYGAAMIAWAHRCSDNALPLCSENKALSWLALSEELWQADVANVPQRHQTEMLSSWSNPDYDTALILTQVTGNISSVYADHVRSFLRTYIEANGTQVWATPKGLRQHPREKWASLRVGYMAAFIAGMYASFPGVPQAEVTEARCFARSQMGYVAGDNPMGMSYVVGFGTKWPLQVHHRDTACTLKEAVDNECYDPATDRKMFFEDRPNPITLIGSIVGGPDTTEAFKDERNEYHYTEVALDYNSGLMSALAAVSSMPPSFWSIDCSPIITNYKFGPYPPKDSKARESAYVRGDNPNAGLDITPLLSQQAADARA